MIKLCCFVKRKPGMDREAFHSHWLEAHGPLIRNTPELAAPILRYEQNHRLDSDYERDPDGFDGVTMQWFDSFTDFAGFVQSDAYRDVLWHDEERFLDRSGLFMIFADPANRVIVDDAARAA
ncbi:MAG: EthD domain-containing protein, partial [Actinomycetota bacterium]|nr:EthD domain-containing protein [Actinomycetota bacterium]